MFPRHNGDALGRADRFTEHAADAAGGAILPDGEPVTTAEARHQGPEFLGILDRGRGAKVGELPETVGNVEEKVVKKVPESDLETTEDLGEIGFLPEG